MVTAGGTAEKNERDFILWRAEVGGPVVTDCIETAVTQVHYFGPVSNWDKW